MAPVKCSSLVVAAALLGGKVVHVKPQDFPPCPICGDGALAASSVDKMITLDSLPPLITEPLNTTCGELDEMARGGAVSEVLCPNFQAAITSSCPCEGDTATFMPTTTPGSSPAPTPGSSPDGSGTATLGFRVVVVTVGATLVALLI